MCVTVHSGGLEEVVKGGGEIELGAAEVQCRCIRPLFGDFLFFIPNMICSEQVIAIRPLQINFLFPWRPISGIFACRRSISIISL